MKSPAQLAADLSRLEPKQDISRRSARSPHPSPAMQEDADYRAAWGAGGNRPYGRQLRAAYYQYLPPAPRGRYVTRDQARIYVGHIHDTIERDLWTPREKESLRQLLRKWERRAAGRDARFNAIGVSGGVNEKHRRKTTADIIQTIYDLIDEYGGKKAVLRPGQRFVSDPKWPLGKPV